VATLSGYRAARTSMDLPVVADVVAAAKLASGESLVLLPTLGGSLPLYLFTDILEAPVVITPVANHDDNQHAPDENLRLANLWYGIDLMATLLTMPSGAAVDEKTVRSDVFTLPGDDHQVWGTQAGPYAFIKDLP